MVGTRLVRDGSGWDWIGVGYWKGFEGSEVVEVVWCALLGGV
jgi:hypothetical protein